MDYTAEGLEHIFDGAKYKSCRNKHNNCQGCYVYENKANEDMCEEVPCDHVIWIKKETTENNQGVMMQETNEETNEEPKYAVEDVLSACEDFGYYVTEHEVESIKKHLAKQNNPDYQLYLKLKEQFGE